MTYDTAFRIGIGGMGEVFKAWDPEVRRFVALKYLRHDDPVMVERLLREARLQARVDHPSVCKVFEVGMEDGRPFIAMEFVDGKLLHEVTEDMSTEQKILIMKEVTEAVQAAHAVGLIHRDLKPANIMIAEVSGGELKPYVLDFGIARENDAAGLTVSGQVLGTPGYLSPEQARGENKNLDRRTDIFSLGVVLYELLSGKMPFPGDSNIEILVNLLKNEATPLARVQTDIPRDLQTIVMRCLEKDPGRRYPSARELADDLGRFLQGEPVTANPVRIAERFLRRARRHPLTTTAFVLAAISLLSLGFVAIGGWIKYTTDLRKERSAAIAAQVTAEAHAREAREISDFLIGVFSISDPDESHGKNVTAREILDRGAEKIQLDLGDRPRIQARLMGVMGEVYARLGLYDSAHSLLEASLKQTISLDEEDSTDEIKARVRLGDLYAAHGNLDQAEEILKSVTELVDHAPNLDAKTAAQALDSVGRLRLRQGHPVEAMEFLERALSIVERELGPDEALAGDLLNDLSYISTRRKLWDQAISQAERALGIREKAYGRDDPRVATTLNNLSLALKGALRLEEAARIGERALRLREETLGPEHPRTSTTLNNLGLIYKKLGRLDRAEELYRRSLALRKRIYGEESSRVATLYINLGGIFFARRDLQQAEKLYNKALQINEHVLGPEHPNTGRCLNALTSIAKMKGDWKEAERFSRRDLKIREITYGPESPNTAIPMRDLGEALLEQGKLEAARIRLEHSRRITLEAYGEGSADLKRIDDLLKKLENTP